MFRFGDVFRFGGASPKLLSILFSFVMLFVIFITLEAVFLPFLFFTGVSHVSALAYRRQDDYVFTHHVSEAGFNKSWDVHGPHSPKALHPMRVCVKTCVLWALFSSANS